MVKLAHDASASRVGKLGAEEGIRTSMVASGTGKALQFPGVLHFPSTAAPVQVPGKVVPAPT